MVLGGSGALNKKDNNGDKYGDYTKYEGLLAYLFSPPDAPSKAA